MATPWAAVEFAPSLVLPINLYSKERAPHAHWIPSTTLKSMDAAVPLDTTKTPTEFVKNLSLNPSIVLLDNTSIRTQVVFLVLDLAKHVSQLLNALHAVQLDIHLILMEPVNPLAVMASFWEPKLVILDWATQLVASIVESKTTGDAQDNLQFVLTILQHQPPLQLHHLRQLTLLKLQSITQDQVALIPWILYIKLEMPQSIPTMSL